MVTYTLDAPVVEYVTPELTACFRGSCDHNDSGANSFQNCNSADRHCHVFAGDVRGASDHVRSGPFVVKCFKGVCFDRVVCLRMARRSSACGWPGRSSADGLGGRLRMAGEVVCGWPGRSSADGPGSSADGDSSSRMVNVVKWVRSGSALAGDRPLGRLLDPGLAVVPFSFELPTTLAITRISTKKRCAQAGTVGGCARVHERIVGSAQSLREKRNNARARERTV